MKCETVRIPGFGVAIVCSRRRLARCQAHGCNRPAARQCDFPTAPGMTCDRYLCSVHAVPQGRGRDHCPEHPMPQGDLFAGAADE